MNFGYHVSLVNDMLPSLIYEPLPYAYIGVAMGGATFSGFSPVAVLSGIVLTASAAIILKMRGDYRRRDRGMERGVLRPAGARRSRPTSSR